VENLMSRTLTPAALIRRLLDVEREDTLAGLARRLRVPERSLQRWASSDDGDGGPEWSTAVQLLERAGWLRSGKSVPLPAKPVDPVAELAAAVRQLTRRIESLEDRLPRR
jgi:hypothetical protein